MPVFLVNDNRHETAPRSDIPAVDAAICEAWNGGYSAAYARRGLEIGNPHRCRTAEWYWWRGGYECGRKHMLEEMG